MVIFQSPNSLVWGSLDLPIFGLQSDWVGDPVLPLPGYSLAMDDRQLWFLAHHDGPACLGPLALDGGFQPDLWQHDVAELFLADPQTGQYIEFNLAPNGAWWCCEFTAPRVRAVDHPRPLQGVRTWAEATENGAWLAALSVPLDPLRSCIGFGPKTRANVAFILGSPRQSFLSAAKLPGDMPDFHQPAHFPPLIATDIPPRPPDS